MGEPQLSRVYSVKAFASKLREESGPFAAASAHEWSRQARQLNYWAASF